MNEIERQVREFHTYFKHPHPSWPTVEVSDEAVYSLRSTLHREELAELTEAVDARPQNVFNVVKEACDLIVVAAGTLVTYGWPLDESFAEVHRSNMSKLGPFNQPIYREDRKVLKGPNFQPADMQAVYARLVMGAES